MKKIYWRPPGVSRAALILIAVVAVVALVAVERVPTQQKQSYYDEKIAAARRAREMMGAIKAAKQELGIRLDPEVDPGGTGMIGESLTPITSNTGYLSAKRTSTNPNFAAVVIDLLKDVDVQRGDVVAVAASGSFPSLNVAAFSAFRTLGVDPLIITSASSSEWGANHVNYLWLDMERTLIERQLVGFRSIAASLGGIDDRGVGISKQGIALLDAAIDRHGVKKIEPKSLPDAVQKRMNTYLEAAAGRSIKAYVNIGGGSASVGTHVGKKLFRPGINRSIPRGASVVDSVMLRMLQEDIPVVHVSRIRLLAERYDLPLAPLDLPPIGQGTMYVTEAYNRWIALGGIAAIVLALLGFIRLDFGVRILRGGRQRAPDKQPEPMV